MSTSTMVKELPETSKWHGAISDEDVQLVRRRHAQKVEEWLDFADFATELFALHEKYGIEKGEEGYFAYRKHLRTNYDHKLATYGPTPDPLDEGCECIFCKMHPVEPSDDSDQSLNHQQPEPEPKPSVASCTDHPPANNHHIISSHCRPDPTPNKNSQTKSRLGLVPAEPPNDFDRLNNQERRSKNRASVPTHVKTARRPPSKKIPPTPFYAKATAERPWLQKMAGSVF